MESHLLGAAGRRVSTFGPHPPVSVRSGDVGVAPNLVVQKLGWYVRKRSLIQFVLLVPDPIRSGICQLGTEGAAVALRRKFAALRMDNRYQYQLWSFKHPTRRIRSRSPLDSGGRMHHPLDKVREHSGFCHRRTTSRKYGP
jgi:hypothetical protein